MKNTHFNYKEGIVSDKQKYLTTIIACLSLVILVLALHNLWLTNKLVEVTIRAALQAAPITQEEQR